MAFQFIRVRRLAQVGLATTVACLAASGVADAACPQGQLSQPFAQFGDNAYYAVAPDGGFEHGGASWVLNGNSVVAGNEPFFVGGAGDSSSLSIKSNTSVVSPSFCVDQDMPSLRLFGEKLKAAINGQLRVDILYTDASGIQHSANAGSLGNGGKQDFASWRPSNLLKLGAAIPMSRGTASVQLRLTADRGGDWLVDDIYVDPRLRH